MPCRRWHGPEPQLTLKRVHRLGRFENRLQNFGHQDERALVRVRLPPMPPLGGKAGGVLKRHGAIGIGEKR